MQKTVLHFLNCFKIVGCGIAKKSRTFLVVFDFLKFSAVELQKKPYFL